MGTFDAFQRLVWSPQFKQNCFPHRSKMGVLKSFLRVRRLPDMEPPDDVIAKQVRAKRDRLIAETDYLAMSDYPLSDEDKAAVMAYRQALRDVPTQEGFPREVVWPEVPAVFKRTKG